MKFSIYLVPMLVLSACQPEPERACERLRYSWPSLELDVSQDSSEMQGFQKDLLLQSDLFSGVKAQLFLGVGDEDEVVVSEALADGEGQLLFEAVTLPTGPAVLLIDARDECGVHRSGRRIFVWDELGEPECDLSLATPGSRDENGVTSLGPDEDEDSLEVGMQATLVVDAGRSDIEVLVFILDRESDTQTRLSLSPNAEGIASQEVTLSEGEQVVRAVCTWPQEDLVQSSPSWVYQVNTSSE